MAYFPLNIYILVLEEAINRNQSFAKCQLLIVIILAQLILTIKHLKSGIMRLLRYLKIFEKFESINISKDIENAHAIYLNIKNAFNEEASSYDANAFNSVLKSTDHASRRKVSSSKSWEFFGGADYEDYSIIAAVIGILQQIGRAHV